MGSLQPPGDCGYMGQRPLIVLAVARKPSAICHGPLCSHAQGAAVGLWGLLACWPSAAPVEAGMFSVEPGGPVCTGVLGEQVCLHQTVGDDDRDGFASWMLCCFSSSPSTLAVPLCPHPQDWWSPLLPLILCWPPSVLARLWHTLSCPLLLRDWLELSSRAWCRSTEPGTGVHRTCTSTKS